MIKKIITFVLLGFIGIPVKAVEIIFNNNSYDVPLIYVLTVIFSCFAFVLKQDIKNIFQFTFHKYNRVTVSLFFCTSYIVIPYSVALFPLVFIRPYINNQSPINLIVFSAFIIIAIIIKETIKKKFSK